MKPLKSNELASILHVELNQGNSITQDVQDPHWPPVSRSIKRSVPFKSPPENDYPSLKYLKVDAFHYWFEEVSDPSTDEVVACGFGKESDRFAPAIEG